MLVTNRRTHRPCHSGEEPGLLKGGVVGPAGLGRWNNRQSRAGQARHGVSAVMLLLHCQQLSCRYSSCVYFHRRSSITIVPRPAAWLLHALSPRTVVLSSGSEQLTMYTMYHKKGTAYVCRKQTSACKLVQLSSFTGFCWCCWLAILKYVACLIFFPSDDVKNCVIICCLQNGFFGWR